MAFCDKFNGGNITEDHTQTQTVRQTADVLTTVKTMCIKEQCEAAAINY